jgi:8-amino-7-oxononanoate synthase
MTIPWMDQDYLSFIELKKSVLAQTGGESPYLKSLPHGNVHRYHTSDGSVVNFSTYDYLGLGESEAVREFAKSCIDRYGVSTSASRTVSGQLDIHCMLEEALSCFLGTEDTVTFVSGHGTNVMTLGYLFRSDDIFLVDKYAHNSIVAGCMLAGGELKRFRHNDVDDLKHLLRDIPTGKRVVVCIEGLYSMDGDLPPLPDILELKRQFGFVLYIDEAHSIGTIGGTGRGVTEYFDVDIREIDIMMGTLSKTLGSCGGFISGSREFIEFLRLTSPGFIFSTGLPAPAAGAAFKATELLSDNPDYVNELQRKARWFNTSLFDQPGIGTPIVPLLVPSGKIMNVTKQCEESGIRVFPIMFPAVPRRATRIRFFLSRLHSDTDLLHTGKTVASIMRDIHDERIEL